MRRIWLLEIASSGYPEKRPGPGQVSPEDFDRDQVDRKGHTDNYYDGGIRPRQVKEQQDGTAESRHPQRPRGPREKPRPHRESFFGVFPSLALGQRDRGVHARGPPVGARDYGGDDRHN